MGEGKWIPDVRPSTPVAKAARKTLEMRAERIRDCLAPALDALNGDPEPVHQLRVGLRRATVALDLFADCLPKKIYRQARRTLRRLRRSAGQARDWDVFLLALRDGAPGRGGAHFLRAFANGQRIAAQAQRFVVIPGIHQLLGQIGVPVGAARMADSLEKSDRTSIAFDGFVARALTLLHHAEVDEAATQLFHMADLLCQLEAVIQCRGCVVQPPQVVVDATENSPRHGQPSQIAVLLEDAPTVEGVAERNIEAVESGLGPCELQQQITCEGLVR